MQFSHPRTVVMITGPTATGKTDLAIELARHWDTCIISADSRQCYRELVIGAAQPSPAQLSAVPHYNIGRYAVTEKVSVADFEQYSLSVLEQQFRDKNTVVVCGGTGLYIKALSEGLDIMPPVPEAIDREVADEYQSSGIEWLQAQVKQLDPVFFLQGEHHNPARLLRALAFVRATGKSILEYRTHAPVTRPFNILKIALDLPRDLLYNRINLRVDKMIEQGLLGEVEGLYSQRHLPALNTVGYSEIFAFLNGDGTLAEAVDKIKQHTRNYAKRQITWFKKEKDVVWLRADDPELALEVLKIKEGRKF